MNLPPPESSSSSSSSSNSSDDVEVGPHGALFMVLGYLQLPELLSFLRICKSFVGPILGDPLLWRRIAVRPPLSARLTDDVLLRMASRAEGKMTSLSLFDCRRITDNALLRVVRANPGINQLYVPGCTSLTVEGVVRVVKWIADHNGNLERLQLHGIGNIRREQLDILNSLLWNGNEHKVPQQLFYGNWYTLSDNGDNGRPIDVDICPKCRNVSLVYDCTRDDCRTMKHRWTECRGCSLCIARCEDCGRCIDYEEVGEETACTHLLCLECWLQLPKCNMCNRPYCTGHGSECFTSGSSDGFTCDQCRDPYVSCFDYEFN